jgi:hypothetical protein
MTEGRKKNLKGFSGLSQSDSHNTLIAMAQPSLFSRLPSLLFSA